MRLAAGFLLLRWVLLRFRTPSHIHFFSFQHGTEFHIPARGSRFRDERKEELRVPRRVGGGMEVCVRQASTTRPQTQQSTQDSLLFLLLWLLMLHCK